MTGLGHIELGARPALDMVSVVVPAHDAATTIGAALRSALAQRPAPLEIVVVDDGSTDGTVAAARAAAADGGPEVRVLSQPQAGPSAARNRGIEACRGDWIALLDADDVWRPDKWAVQRQALAAHPEAVAVAADWVRHDGAFGAGEGPPAPSSDSPAVTVVTEVDLLRLNRFQTSTVVARADALRAVGGFDSALDGVEDWDCWRRLAAHGPIVKVDQPLVAYTDQADGYSKDLVRVYETALRMLNAALAPLPRRSRRRLLAWHHLRFAVAFRLAGDRATARRCLTDSWNAGLLSAVPGAAVMYLAPFLFARLRRRAAR